jgi:hypothetical protein
MHQRTWSFCVTRKLRVSNNGQGYPCWNEVGTRLLPVGSCQVVPRHLAWKRDLIGVGWMGK